MELFNKEIEAREAAKVAARQRLERENSELLSENLTLRKRLEELSTKMAAFEQQIAALKNTPKKQPIDDEHTTTRKKRKKAEKSAAKPLEEMETIVRKLMKIHLLQKTRKTLRVRRRKSRKRRRFRQSC